MKFDAACAASRRKHGQCCLPGSGRLSLARSGFLSLSRAGSTSNAVHTCRPHLALGLAVLAASVLGGCASGDGSDASDPRFNRRRFTDAKYGALVVDPNAPVPKGGGSYKVGAPYRMGGRWYVPREEPGYDAVGQASWYGEDFHARRTANGEVYDMHALTAAHPTLPLPSYAWVTNQANGRTVLVRVNDRGPYARDRIIDLSRAAARELGYEGHGTAQVRVRYAGPAPLDGNDARERQVLAQAWWHRGPQLASGSGPAWQAPRQPLARPQPPQPRFAAAAPTPPAAAPYAPPRASYAGRDDYAALIAQGRATAPAPPPRPTTTTSLAPTIEQASDAPRDSSSNTDGWSVSGYRQGIAGQRRSLGGP